MLNNGKKNKQLTLAILTLAGTLILAIILSYALFTAASAIFNKKPNIILITARSLRPDHLSCYGYRHTGTPAIDSLSYNGVYFTNAYTPSPSVILGYTSIMTGLNTEIFSGRKKDFMPESGHKTLPEYLKTSGYSTSVIITDPSIEKNFTLTKGFENIFSYPATSENKRSLSFWNGPAEKALSLMQQAQAERVPCFIWMEYSLPLAPYTVPEEFKSYSQEHNYDRQIALLDQSIATLLTSLRKQELTRNTVIIFTSATGEGLKEHTEPLHGTFIYNSTTKVPLILHLPLDTRSQSIETPVSLEDILPTVLSLAKIPLPGEMNNIDLLSGKIDTSPRSIYLSSLFGYENFAWSPPAAIIKNGYKYIELPKRELYSLKQDPHELTNIITEHPGMAKELREELYENLKALGSPLEDHLDTGADPKDKISVFNSFMSYRPQSAQGSIYFYKKLLGQDPDNITIKYALARAYLISSKYYDAKKILNTIIKQRPSSAKAWEQLGIAYTKQLDYENAMYCFEKALSIDPKMHISLRTLARYYSTKGNDLDKALGYAKAAVEFYPEDLSDIDALGNINFKTGNLKDAIRLMRDALKMNISPEQKKHIELNIDMLEKHLSEANTDQKKAINNQ